MAFKYGYRIEKGMFAGKVLSTTSKFPDPYKQGGVDYSYFGVTPTSGSTTWWDAPHEEFYDSNTSLMVDVTGAFYQVTQTGQSAVLAKVPLYAGEGSAETKTGYLCIGIESFNGMYEWYVKVWVEDINETNVSQIVSSTSFAKPHGGWADMLSNFKIYLGLTGYESNGVKVIGLFLNSCFWALEPYGVEYGCVTQATGSVIRLNTIRATFGIDADGNGDPIEFDEELGEASEPEGYDQDGTGPGTYDDSSDSISNVPDPAYGILDAGFVNVYKVTTGALTALGNDVFPQLQNVTDLVTGLQCVSDMLFNSRLIDYVLDVHIIPCNVPAEVNTTPVKIGGRTCSALGYKVTDNYVNVDLGTIEIGEYFKNFADYSYTSSKLHLPGIGFVDMKPEFWNGGALNVKYKFNVADGSFMAYVYATSSKSKLKSSLVAQYSGQAAIHIPVTGASYSSAISGLLASAGGTITSATTGNIAGVAAGVVSAAANSSPDINQSNGYNSSASIMGCKKVYLQIERPAYSMSVGSRMEQGFPLNVYKRLGDCHGLTIVDECVLNFACSDEEAREIIAALKEGVII